MTHESTDVPLLEDAAREEDLAAPDGAPADAPELSTALGKFEAEYALECPVRCPACGELISTLKAVRVLRSKVNFTSTLPRRGRIIACPRCLAIVPAELSNF